MQITYILSAAGDALSKGISKNKNTHQSFSSDIIMGVFFFKMPRIFSVFNPYYLPGITRKKRDLMCRVKPQGCGLFKHHFNSSSFQGAHLVL